MAESFPGDVMPKDRRQGFTFMVECKHQEGWSLDALLRLWPDYKLVKSWWDQCMSARHYGGRFHAPLLLIKKNRYPVLAMLRVCDIPRRSRGRALPIPHLLLHGGSGTHVSRPIAVMTLNLLMESYRYADF